MSRFFNRSLDRLVPYTPGEQPQDQQYVKLNTNESPYPPSPGVIAALNAREAADLRLYSDRPKSSRRSWRSGTAWSRPTSSWGTARMRR